MKKLTHLGCLLALVFAGASAFADSWFENVVTAEGYEKTDGEGWYVPSERAKWEWKNTYGTLNDWDVGAVYTAAVAKAVSSYDSKITTEVKFTAMDEEDLATYTIAGAKAGVTLVEKAANSYQFKVIQKDTDGVSNVWVDAGEPVSSNYFANPLVVTVEIYRSDDYAMVKYSIGEDISVDPSAIGAADSTSIKTVVYKGQCDLYYNLMGLAWGNVSGTPSAVEITSHPQDYEGPTTIKYNHGDLKARLGADADSDAKVIEYMTGKQANGQFGWVNYALGQEDADPVCVSNAVASANGLSFDFGFLVDTDNYEVSYTVDTKAAAATAEVGIESGVHTVAVTVKDKNGGQTYNVTNQVVGVMQAESPASEGKGPGTNVYEIVAVPWEAFGHGAVTVENLLVTSLLTNGDTLYVWNDEGYYDTYTLTGGKWVAQDHTSFSSQTGAVTVKGTPAQDNALVQGTAVWIEHDVRSKIVFTGMLENDSPASKVKTTVYGGDQDTWTLVANPSINPFALADITGAAEGDRIVVEDAADPREYECKKEGGSLVWGYDKKVIDQGKTITVRGKTIPVYTTEWTVADPIPAGIGFWYVRKAEGEDLEITFGDNN